MIKAPHRRFSLEFKLQVCSAIRAGRVGRREAEREHRLSGGLIQSWLSKFDAGEFGSVAHSDRRVTEEYERRIAELERKVGQLTMEAELLKKSRDEAPLSRDDFFVLSGPRAARSGGPVR
jgi:transposase-like protein